jgi:hypothetical protein
MLRVTLMRVGMMALGFAAVRWGMVTLPIYWRQSPLEWMARGIAAGEPFKMEALIGQVPAIEGAEQATFCRPIALRSAAIISLRIAEEEIASNDQAVGDRDMKLLRDAIYRALECSPADAFLWLTLYWLETTGSEVRPEYLRYLRMSYRLGPNEGWIAVKRNSIALASYEQLPSDIKTLSVHEFADLLESGFYTEVLTVLTNSAWRLRDVLMASIANVPERHRRALADLLYQRGYDVDVPGVNRTRDSWHWR